MMKKPLMFLGVLLGGITAYKMYAILQLKHFKLHEFGLSFPFLSVGLINKLDDFRDALGYPVMISPSSGSLIRFDIYSESQHVFGRAADIMLPEGPDLKTAYMIAKRVGFMGIGVYPDWKPYPGMHLDVRPGNFAHWAGILKDGQQVYVAVQQVIGSTLGYT